jgi:hypothetical protein
MAHDRNGCRCVACNYRHRIHEPAPAEPPRLGDRTLTDRNHVEALLADGWTPVSVTESETGVLKYRLRPPATEGALHA